MFRGCLGDVSRTLQECLGNVSGNTKDENRQHKADGRSILAFFKSFFVLISKRFGDISWIFRECFGDVSGRSRRCFGDILGRPARPQHVLFSCRPPVPVPSARPPISAPSVPLGDLSGGFRGCFGDVSGMFRGRFRNVLGTFREILRMKLGSTKQTE